MIKASHASRRQYGPQQLAALSSSIGDVFWGLSPYITYIAGTSIGVTIYVANPSSVDRDYALLSRLVGADGKVILEESITVYQHAWFTVESGQYIELQAELAFDVSNAVLSVVLVEKSTDSDVDSVSTYLVAPTAAQLPPGFPAPTPTPTTMVAAGFDWSPLFQMMMFIPMFGLIASMNKENTSGSDQRGEQKRLSEGERLKELPVGHGYHSSP
jgi:hypothetical protein